MTLRLSLQGRPLMERDGDPVALGTHEAVALLAYLGVTDRRQRCETLSNLLWPYADRKVAAAALCRTLADIRDAVGGEVLVSDDETLALDPGAVTVDVRRIRELLAGTRGHDHAATTVCRDCVAPLAEIAELHRGAFLEGFALRDSSRYDEWQSSTAEQLQRELAEALARLTEAGVLTGDLKLATRAARRRLALEPLHEPAHRVVMRLHAWQGHHEEVLRQYRECVRVLGSELGVGPLEETTRLCEDALAGRVVTPSPATELGPGPATSPPVASVLEGSRRGRPGVRRVAPVNGERDAAASGSRDRPPFVARERELAMLSTAIERVHTDGMVVIVEGEAGSGKTRLLEELATRPEVSDRCVLSTVCRRDETGRAYGVVAELLRSAIGPAPATCSWFTDLRSDVAREVGRVLPEVAELTGPTWPVDGPGATWRLIDALATALAAAASDGRQPPGVLVVDDVQWIDESSLDVLSRLAHRLEGRPVCVVLIWPTELVDRGHRLRRLVADLACQQRVRQLPLARLDAGAVRILVDDALGEGHPDLAKVTEQVMETTEGVPLLVVEYLAALVRDPDAMQNPVPQGAKDLLSVRLSAIGPCARQVLTAAAVLGRPFDSELIRHVSGRTHEETLGALADLTVAGLIAEPGHGRLGYDCTHRHVRALAYEQAGRVRQRLLHRRVAAALERRVRHRREDQSLASTIAAHHAAAGDGPAAARWFARAGAHAGKLLAITEAVAHYEEALAHGHHEPAHIQESLGDLQGLVERYDLALARYEAAAAVASDERQAELGLKIAGVYQRRCQWTLADRHLAIAQSVVEDRGGSETAALRARILIDRGLVAHRRGHVGEAASLARAALLAASDSRDLSALAGAHNLLGVLSKQDLSAARHHLERALALARKQRDVGVEVAAANNLAQAHAAAGALDRALPLAESALARVGQLADRHREAALRNNLAGLLRAAGRHEEAMLHLKRAVTLFAEIGEPDERAPEIWKVAAW
jgi:predicted ATPase/DNA-binding SARP family transcriptional activator